MVSLTSQSFVACASPQQSTNRRQRRRADTTCESDGVPNGGSHLLVFLDSETVILCYATSLLEITSMSHTRVSFDTCVTVGASPAVPWSRYTTNTQTWFQLHHLTSTEGTCRAEISPPQDTPRFPHVSILTQSQSLPLLSLSLTLESVDPPMDHGVESQPLLLSCLKSQLYGIFLLWEEGAHGKIQSTIRVNVLGRVFCLRTQSLLVSSASRRTNKASILYRIWPSTKITILGSSATATTTNSTATTIQKDSETKRPTVLSPTARYLVDTLRCLEKNSPHMPSASQLRFILLSGPPGSEYKH